MRTILSAEIVVERFAVFAEMAWMERRPELGALCRAAMADGDRVSVATVQSALPGLPDAGARNVMSWCQMLGLCDAQGGLTELGKDVADSDEAPVPEQGIYGFWVAQHPLIGRRILVVERLNSNRDHRFDAIQPLRAEPGSRRGVSLRGEPRRALHPARFADKPRPDRVPTWLNLSDLSTPLDTRLQR